jgi:hypothetical protein
MRGYVRELKARLDAPRSAYFSSLGELSREDFLETQVQFLSPVAHFAKPMEVLAARLPETDRRSLIDNIADEHGHGDRSASHERTFIDLLSKLGVPESSLATYVPWPEVDAFNAALTGTCVTENPLMGVAMLAIIEDIFADLSARIGSAIVERGWLAKSEIVHYATHEVLDVHHAESFYEVVAPHWPDPAIQRGLELGGYVFVRMYDDLYKARARRWRR